MVTVAYRSGEMLEAMLDALPLDRLAGVVIVDNGGDPADARTAERHRESGVTLVGDGENIGFGAGCNRGAAAAPAARWLLMLNPDAVLQTRDLETLVDYAETHPEAGVVGPSVTGRVGPSTSSGDLATLRTELAHHGPPLLRRLGHRRRHPPGRATGPVGYVEGGCMLIDALAFAEVGGFDEGMFLYYEECELSRRMGELGRSVHLCADADVYHPAGTEDRAHHFEVTAQLWASAVHHLRSWEGRRAAVALQAALALRLALLFMGGRVPARELGRGWRGITDRARPPQRVRSV